ncbi:MAG TPA: hypothetical protein VGM18_13970 [Candidatus Sulfotelmatobacter sp.]|jgi:hypothetical protein
MDTIVITGNEDIPLDHLRSLLALHWSLLKTPSDRLAIEDANSRVYIYHPKLEGGEIDPRRVFLDYSSLDIVKKVVQVIADDPNLLIDNDSKTVLPGDQFVAKLRADPTWNWRA